MSEAFADNLDFIQIASEKRDTLLREQMWLPRVIKANLHGELVAWFQRCAGPKRPSHLAAAAGTVYYRYES